MTERTFRLVPATDEPILGEIRYLVTAEGSLAHPIGIVWDGDGWCDLECGWRITLELGETGPTIGERGPI